jgi:hypothetical protein
MERATIVEVELASLSPYSQSRFHNTPKIEKELAEAYEARTWKNRVHLNEKKHLIVPGMAIKKSLEGAAKLSKKKIPGKGASTWTQHIISGISPLSDLDTGLTDESILGEWIHCDAQGGARGNHTRVLRCYPMVKAWRGTADFALFDELITKEVLTEFLVEAGLQVGVGRFRPANGGTKGRYRVVNVVWKPLSLKDIEKRLAA